MDQIDRVRGLSQPACCQRQVEPQASLLLGVGEGQVNLRNKGREIAPSAWGAGDGHMEKL